MPLDSPVQKAPKPGEVRIRSNVCRNDTDWHLVPGDLATHFVPSRDLTRQQRSERMYYERCCLCHRNSFEIEEEGCDYCASAGHGTLSIAEAKRRRQQRFSQQQDPS